MKLHQAILSVLLLLSLPAHVLAKDHSPFTTFSDGNRMLRMISPSEPPLPQFVPNQVVPTPSPPVPVQKSAKVFSELATFTGGTYRASGNVINFPLDVSAEIADAKRDNAPLDIIGVHVKFSGNSNLAGIPRLRVMAHLCTFEQGTMLNISALPQTSLSSPPAASGMTPPKAEKGIDGGQVDLLCGFMNAANSRINVKFASKGSVGVAGGSGGDGQDGIDGTKGKEGSCRRRLFGCRKRRGSPGRKSTPGTNGGNGGQGGDGGNGGNLNVIHNGVQTGLVITGDYGGGAGGAGGQGGRAGVNGKFIKPIRYVTGCKRRCRSNRKTEDRPILPPTRPGDTGTRGFAGKAGSVVWTSGLLDPSDRFGPSDYLRFSSLLERYSNDLVLSDSSCEEAISVVATIQVLASTRSDSAILKNIANRGAMSAKSLELQKSLFGPASHSRRAPMLLEAELRREIDYAEAVKDQLGRIKLETNILSVLTETAAISIPATDYNRLRRDLRIQRTLFRDAVTNLEGRIESALDQINVDLQAHINRKRDAADQARQRRIIKAALSVINIGTGLFTLNVKSFFDSAKATIEVINDLSSNFKGIVNDFKEAGKAAKGVKNFLGNAFGIANDIKEVSDAFQRVESSSSCSIRDLKALLLPAPDRLDKFPNLVSLDADFSKIQDVGVVSELSKALSATRASTLTAQFGCLFGENLDDVPSVKVAIDNYFILSNSRLDILARMVDIDIELRRLNILAEGVDDQKRQLQNLRDDVSSASRSDVFVLLSITFENARMSVMETMDSLTKSFSSIVLRSMNEDILAYAQERLEENGVLAFSSSTQFVNLRRLNNDILDGFAIVRGCTGRRQSLTSAYFSFDLTAENNPEIFARGMGTGPNNRTAINLDIERDCAVYANSRPPMRGARLTGTGRQCHPGMTKYNSRMVSLAVELLGGDQTLLPPRMFEVFATIEQVGRQGFHAKPGFYTYFDVDPFHFSLGSLRLKSDGPSYIRYNPTCVVSGGLDTVNLDEPRICPSPFSTYILQIGLNDDPELHLYLATVTTIRVHTQLVSNTDGRTAQICFDN